MQLDAFCGEDLPGEAGAGGGGWWDVVGAAVCAMERWWTVNLRVGVVENY